VVPIQADVSDFERVEQMFELLAKYRQNGEAKCQVQLVLWNRMSSYRANACEIGHFTPPKVAVDDVNFLNGKLTNLKRTHGGLFATSFDTVLVKDFPDTVACSAKACGLAFCRMGKGKVKTRGGATFDVKSDQLETCNHGIDMIMEKLESDAASP